MDGVIEVTCGREGGAWRGGAPCKSKKIKGEGWMRRGSGRARKRARAPRTPSFRPPLITPFRRLVTYSDDEGGGGGAGRGHGWGEGVNIKKEETKMVLGFFRSLARP